MAESPRMRMSRQSCLASQCRRNGVPVFITARGQKNSLFPLPIRSKPLQDKIPCPSDRFSQNQICIRGCRFSPKPLPFTVLNRLGGVDFDKCLHKAVDPPILPVLGISQNFVGVQWDWERSKMASGSDSLKPRDVCIVGVARTPVGGLLGSLSSFSATQLGSIAIKSALKRANIDPSLVQEVFFGNVLSANLGQAPARQAALGAGIPNSVVCTTINKVCASGMKAAMLAAQTIRLGENDVVVAGGMESMSNAPKYLAAARKGSRLGHDTVVDGMLKDGLWDVYNDIGMGVCGEICADKYRISREQQDSYAIKSFERGIAAQKSGLFAWEMIPVEVSGGRGKPSTIIDKDEGLEKFDAARLRKLRPSFKENGGSVTAGNASSISDGAAALVLVSGKKALELGLNVIAKIKGYGDAAQAPEFFTTAPALAIPKAISHAGLDAGQIDYYEINEAFSVVVLANQKLLCLKPERVNAHGGAVSLGHPIGCSGARILITLLGVLRHKNGKYGVGAVCNGGGGASAVVVELMPVPRNLHSSL